MKQMQIAELTYIYEMMIYRMSVIVCMNTVTRFCSALLDQGKMNKRFGYSSRPLTPLYGPGSIVGIVTGYRLDGPGNESRWGRDFPHLSRLALWSTQPPVQWVPGLFRG